MASNPFRKARPEDRILALDSLDTTPAATPPPPVSFKTQPAPAPPPRSESPLPPAIVTSESREKKRNQKNKVVKKVRVLSPPQSPDDGEGEQQGIGAAWPFNVPMAQKQNIPQAQDQNQMPMQMQQVGAGSAFFPSVEEFERDSAQGPDDSITQDEQATHEAQSTQSPMVAATAAAASSAPPPNPFSKTLHDLENVKQEVKQEEKKEELHHQEELEGAALKAGNLAKGSLDVDAFRRLLMTGKPHDGTASPVPSKSQIVADLAGSDAGDAVGSSASSTTGDGSESSSPASGSPFVRAQDNGAERRSGLAVELTPEDLEAEDERKGRGDESEDDVSESDSSVSVQIGSRGKKPPPPPPSSRHGRSILSKSPAQDTGATSRDRDVNKPLPPAPALSTGDDETDSPFDREAAGKVPESDTSLEDTTSGSAAPPSASTPKKPVPAPPPRRGHSRTDTKTANTALSPSRAAGKEDEAPPRSSMDSADHGAAANQALKPPGHAPAPPPPRRPTSGSKTGSQNPPQAPASAGTPSPGLSPSTEFASLHEPESQPGELQRSTAGGTAPPPPPARHGSTRRPTSVHAPEGPAGLTRRGTGTRAGAPAPPPPRQRGSSKGSVDGHAARAVAAQHGGEGQTAADAGKGGDILADLEALQREVDAMRGKVG